MRRTFCLALAISLSIPLSAQRPQRQRPQPQPAAAALAPEARMLPDVEAAHLRGLKARSIGPAVMSGRVSDIALDPANPAVFYVALGTGGVMKTSDGGTSWEAIFEKQPVAAIGDIAVAPSDSRIVWVGTGEANDRNSSSWGNGVYRSTDGGETWQHVGLKNSKTIARILVHPADPNTVWVAAMGDLWNWNEERGCYKTTDGGKTWRKVLAAAPPYDTRVGCGDLALDPSNPNILYAALYARRRTPWSFLYGPLATDGKDLGGIFKSTDGGETWQKLAGGLPAETGRIGLAVYAGNPQIVYAIVQSDAGGMSGIDEVYSRAGGVFRSEDGGASWQRMSALNPRPFYFSQIRVDPKNDQRVYVLGFALHVSDDGGRTWREDLFEKVHPDCHALEIDPRFPQRLLLGTDGGPYESWNGGKSWRHLNNFAAGEFYRINVDLSTPYRICGGLQDNLNWVGPSRTWSREGILNSDWINIGGGDGFYCVFDSEQPHLVYTESQQGFLHRFDLSNGQMKPLRPEPTEGQPAFRFHWNAPLIGSRHTPGVLYLAGNVVFRLTTRGERWRIISPDLSTQELTKMIAVGSGAENYGVVYTLAESPLRPGLLWAGTDDGKVWLTENEGQSWTDLTAHLPAEARGQWISRIEASGHDPQVAYLAVDAHRSGNYAPLVYRTADGGRSWHSIAGDLPPDGPVKVIREDPRNPDLLYVGTEFKLFVSLDRGKHWIEFGGLPTVAVDDLIIHPRDNDLIIATHGRSLFIVDDLRGLQELTPEVRQRELTLFAPRPAFGRHLLPGFADWNGKAIFRGENPPEGALITFYIGKFTGQNVEIRITNAQGQPVAKFERPGVPGINRLSWDLRPTANVLTEYGGEGRKFVPAGEYTVQVSYGETKVEQKLRVEIAPGVETR
ncbi:MAG: hypothetical protein K6U09_09755 [Acidobacteriia bacterium]|jgi:photosystem II stability/assembly factor-like uncharacterized protein|nr:hypothetical protein [Terriglobia bacterium]